MMGKSTAFEVLFLVAITARIVISCLDANVNFCSAASIVGWIEATQGVHGTSFGWLLLLMAFSSFMGVASGSPMPTVEGLALPAFFHFAPRFVLHSSEYLQGAFLVFGAIWFVSFLYLTAKFICSSNQWVDWPIFSPVHLFMQLLERSKKRAT